MPDRVDDDRRDTSDDDVVLDTVEAAVGPWWLYLLGAAGWFILAFLVLNWKLASVWAVAIFAAIVFITGGVIEFIVAAIAPSWKWLHALMGIVSIAAGIIAIAWPGETFIVLAAILAWYLLIAGFFDLVVGFMVRDVNDQWWLQVLLGIAEILVGFWAIGYTGRSVALLVIWVAAVAIARGLADIFVAFGLHDARQQARALRTAIS
jgi:uncharacterized membrane protein HdeD (DUF308 family)